MPRTNEPDEVIADTPVAAEDSDRLSLADHLTYSQQLYGQPDWVMRGVFAHAKLDPMKNHSKAVVDRALSDMLGQTDKRYEGSR